MREGILEELREALQEKADYEKRADEYRNKTYSLLDAVNDRHEKDYNEFRYCNDRVSEFSAKIRALEEEIRQG